MCPVTPWRVCKTCYMYQESKRKVLIDIEIVLDTQYAELLKEQQAQNSRNGINGMVLL